MNIIVEK